MFFALTLAFLRRHLSHALGGRGRGDEVGLIVAMLRCCGESLLGATGKYLRNLAGHMKWPLNFENFGPRQSVLNCAECEYSLYRNHQFLSTNPLSHQIQPLLQRLQAVADYMNWEWQLIAIVFQQLLQGQHYIITPL